MPQKQRRLIIKIGVVEEWKLEKVYNGRCPSQREISRIVQKLFFTAEEIKDGIAGWPLVTTDGEILLGSCRIGTFEIQ